MAKLKNKKKRFIDNKKATADISIVLVVLVSICFFALFAIAIAKRILDLRLLLLNLIMVFISYSLNTVFSLANGNVYSLLSLFYSGLVGDLLIIMFLFYIG